MRGFFKILPRSDIQSRLNAIMHRLDNLEDLIMATKQEVLDAVAAESAEVTERVNALSEQVRVLQEQLDNGSVVTAADLDEIQSAVQAIFTQP